MIIGDLIFFISDCFCLNEPLFQDQKVTLDLQKRVFSKLGRVRIRKYL